MTKEEIQTLYKEKVLPEVKSPFHFEKDQNADHVIEAYNPLCGDKYKIYIREDSVCFHGFGCAVSKSSTSILLRTLEGKSKEAKQKLCEDFIKSFEEDRDVDLPEELRILLELRNFEGRVDCIQLSWIAMLEYLKNED